MNHKRAKTPLLAFSLAALVLLAGCTASPTDQTVKVDKNEILDKHVVANCPVGVDGNEGIRITVEECDFSLSAGKIEAASMTCNGLTGNYGGLPYGNRESTFTLTYYSADAYTYSQKFAFDIEAGDSAAGTCTITGPTTGNGEYTVRFAAVCFKDSKAYLPGFQAKRDGCTIEDTFNAEKEGWF